MFLYIDGGDIEGEHVVTVDKSSEHAVNQRGPKLLLVGNIFGFLGQLLELVKFLILVGERSYKLDGTKRFFNDTAQLLRDLHLSHGGLLNLSSKDNHGEEDNWEEDWADACKVGSSDEGDDNARKHARQRKDHVRVFFTDGLSDDEEIFSYLGRELLNVVLLKVCDLLLQDCFKVATSQVEGDVLSKMLPEGVIYVAENPTTNAN